MARHGGRYPVGGKLSTPGSQNPAGGQRRETSYSVNRASSSNIDEALSYAVIGAQLRQPPAVPNPMSKQRISPAGQESRGSATCTQAPSLCRAANGDHGCESDTEHL